MADKLDYTIQIDGDQYDVTAADSLHADLANQVEEALIVKKSVRKSKNYKAPDSDTELKDIESLTIRDLKDAIGNPSTAIGVDADGDTIDRTAANAFAFKGDSEAEIEVVPSSGGVFTGPIYAPDVDAGDGFNINKFQVTNYNSVDTIVRELKGFPVYEWTGTRVLALTEGTPPTMLPFKVIIYTGPASGNTDYWTETHRKNLRLVNGNPDGTTTDCTTDGNFFLINAKAGHLDYGRILLGTFDHSKTTNCSTYVELRVKEADHAKTLATAMGDKTTPIYLNTNGVPDICDLYAGGTNITLNGKSKAASTATFYAPEGSDNHGNVNDVLLSQGETETPTWSAQSNLHVGSATTVTGNIGNQTLGDIFVYNNGTMTSQVQSAAIADSAKTVTEKIGSNTLSSIFVNGTSKVQSAARADSAASADVADTLYTYSVGGSSSTAYFSAQNAGYILYGNNDVPTGKHLTEDGILDGDNLFNEGNIYIKIEP